LAKLIINQKKQKKKKKKKKDKLAKLLQQTSQKLTAENHNYTHVRSLLIT